MTMLLIQTVTLTSTEATIEFTSIPQTYTDLRFLTATRNDDATNLVTGLLVSLNGSTSGLAVRRMTADGVSASSNTDLRPGLTNGGQATANTFSNGSIYFPNYASSSSKSFYSETVTENNGTNAYQSIVAGSWTETSAISSISFSPFIGSFVAGSTISLYGITKGSDGITTVT